MFPPTCAPTFSGHETFVLRSTWLKKGYDTIRQYSDLFVQPEEVSQVKIFLLPEAAKPQTVSERIKLVAVEDIAILS